MKKILCLAGLILTLHQGWSQINEKDTIATSISATNKAVVFQADVLPDYINLQWIKGPDEPSAYFELYRSPDGVAYNIIRQFHPQTFDGSDKYYYYKDEAPLSGKNYYRLVAYDKFTNEKKIVDIVAEYKNKPRRIMPTVLSNGNQLNINNYDGERLELMVYSSGGSFLLKKIVASSVIDLSENLSKGLYVYQLVNRSKLVVSSGKFILQ